MFKCMNNPAVCAILTLAIIISVLLIKSAYDGISGEDADQMSTHAPAGIMEWHENTKKP